MVIDQKEATVKIESNAEEFIKIFEKTCFQNKIIAIPFNDSQKESLKEAYLRSLQRMKMTNAEKLDDALNKVQAPINPSSELSYSLTNTPALQMDESDFKSNTNLVKRNLNSLKKQPY